MQYFMGLETAGATAEVDIADKLPSPSLMPAVSGVQKKAKMKSSQDDKLVVMARAGFGKDQRLRHRGRCISCPQPVVSPSPTTIAVSPK